MNAVPIDGVAWERLKQRVKNAAIIIGLEEARDRKAKLSRLVECLRSLVEENEERPGSFELFVAFE